MSAMHNNSLMKSTAIHELNTVTINLFDYWINRINCTYMSFSGASFAATRVPSSHAGHCIVCTCTPPVKASLHHHKPAGASGRYLEPAQPCSCCNQQSAHCNWSK